VTVYGVRRGRARLMTMPRKSNVEQDYFLWLCDLVEGGLDHKYRELLWYLHRKDFDANLPNDDNRAEDGKKLREQYFYAILQEDHSVWNTPCTMLEMLIALAQRIEFIMSDEDKGDRTAHWFWEMVKNLGLKKITKNDLDMESKIHANDSILTTFHNRSYRSNGKGGLFPLKELLVEDQRKVEIWYQMQAYIQECCP
jgi:hypothetical protein